MKLLIATTSLILTALVAPAATAGCNVVPDAAAVCTFDPDDDGVPDGFFAKSAAATASGSKGENHGGLSVGTEHAKASGGGHAMGDPTHGMAGAAVTVFGAGGMTQASANAADMDTDGDGDPDQGHLGASVGRKSADGASQGGFFASLVDADKDGSPDFLVVSAGSSATGNLVAQKIPLP